MSSTRQLAAILFADIQGYTAMMQDDEVNANLLREKLKKNLEQEVGKHNGRVLKLSGDGALCIFNSAIEAVRAAIGIQKEMLQEPKVPLRIGIHTGDVMFEEGDVYGDGVNVASRIESFAVAGGVFISDRVYADIKNQKDISAISLGNYELKNVSAPVEIFAISNEGLVVPEKKKKLEGKGKQYSARRSSSTKMLIMMLTLAVIMVASFLLYKKFQPASVLGNERTIAVLPFTNLSESKDDEYFSDGMCDEIFTQLSKIGSLNVLSRTATLQFKDTKKTMKEIGDEIGADVLLAGSVQKSNEKVRISVQLIDAKSNKQLWADTYDKEFKDIFSIQSDVATSVAAQLKTKLTSSEKARIEKKPTENLEAYNLYLKGNFLIRKITPEDLTNGLAMLNQAIKLDPKFALPYLGIATYYAIATDFYLAPSVAMPQLKIAAQTAIEMDSTIAEAHVWLGMYEHWYAWDWDKADKEFQTALRLEPSNYMAHWIYSFYLLTMSRIDEAKIEGARFTELEPITAEAHAWNGLIFFFSRQYDDALPEIDKALVLDPNYPFALYFHGAYNLEEGKFPEAIADQKKAHELFAAPWSYGRLAYAYARTGKTKDAVLILDSLKKESATIYVASDVVASVYVALGDKEQSFEYLEKAVDERAGWLAFIKVDPIWDPIRNDPRFETILKRIGLDEASLKH